MCAVGLGPGRLLQDLDDEERTRFERHNLVVMVRFAGAMMKKLHQLNQDTYQTFNLRFGEYNQGVIQTP